MQHLRPTILLELAGQQVACQGVKCRLSLFLAGHDRVTLFRAPLCYLFKIDPLARPPLLLFEALDPSCAPLSRAHVACMTVTFGAPNHETTAPPPSCGYRHRASRTAVVIVSGDGWPTGPGG